MLNTTTLAHADEACKQKFGRTEKTSVPRIGKHESKMRFSSKATPATYIPREAKKSILEERQQKKRKENLPRIPIISGSINVKTPKVYRRTARARAGGCILEHERA